MRLSSDFALLDVKWGSRQLDKMIDRNGKFGSERHKLPERIPVTIRGWITHRHGAHDGESQEFGVEVASVEVEPKTEQR